MVAGHEEQGPVEPEDPVGLEPHLVQQQHPGCCRRFAEDPHGSMMYRLGLGVPTAYYCSSGGAAAHRPWRPRALSVPVQVTALSHASDREAPGTHKLSHAGNDFQQPWRTVLLT
jgi:hypothetical protein